MHTTAGHGDSDYIPGKDIEILSRPLRSQSLTSKPQLEIAPPAKPQLKVSLPPPRLPWTGQCPPPSKLQHMREAPQPSPSAALPSHLDLSGSIPRDPRNLKEPGDLRDLRGDPYTVRDGRSDSIPPRDPREERYLLETQRIAAESRMSAEPGMVFDQRDPRVMGHPSHQHSHWPDEISDSNDAAADLEPKIETPSGAREKLSATIKGKAPPTAFLSPGMTDCLLTTIKLDWRTALVCVKQ